MRVTIESVLDPASGLVEFQSELGASRGRWAGAMPVPGTTYFVEFDVNKVLTVGTDFVVVDDVDQPSIGGDGDRSVLIGILERIEDDGIVIFRLGKCLIMLEVEGAPLTKGACVRVGPVHLSLSDMNY